MSPDAVQGLDLEPMATDMERPISVVAASMLQYPMGRRAGDHRRPGGPRRATGRMAVQYLPIRQQRHHRNDGRCDQQRDHAPRCYMQVPIVSPTPGAIPLAAARRATRPDEA
ncbi:MAG: hypothetical protein A2V85_12340 [Chloroflexi bacterium RBG_16_72_14]|nr:MAG: hypothetical protein A2V85_12340 [Chloroflexi bacterium RBG_16_72_14]